MDSETKIPLGIEKSVVGVCKYEYVGIVPFTCGLIYGATLKP